jgi:hypothetical protein
LPSPIGDEKVKQSLSYLTQRARRKHGGKVSYWTVIVGEIGNFVFSVNFESFAAYGAAMDKLGADPEFQAWQVKRAKAGLSTWVRSNMATEIEI